jgi:hypothetical protein
MCVCVCVFSSCECVVARRLRVHVFGARILRVHTQWPPQLGMCVYMCVRVYKNAILVSFSFIHFTCEAHLGALRLGLHVSHARYVCHRCIFLYVVLHIKIPVYVGATQTAW